MSTAGRDRILDELRRAWDGGPWHGDALKTILRGFPPEAADARPVPNAHTATEIVLHLAAWTREVTRRLRDGVARDPAEGDWPAAAGSDFRATVDGLGSAHAALLQEVAAFPPDALDDTVNDARDATGGAGVSYGVMLHGIAQHYAYHGGQVALLRKTFTP